MKAVAVTAGYIHSERAEFGRQMDASKSTQGYRDSITRSAAAVSACSHVATW